MLGLGRTLACALAPLLLAGCGPVGGSDEPRGAQPAAETTLPGDVLKVDGRLELDGPCTWLRADDTRYALRLDDDTRPVGGDLVLDTGGAGPTRMTLASEGEKTSVVGTRVDLQAVPERCRAGADRAVDVLSVGRGTVLLGTATPQATP